MRSRIKILLLIIILTVGLLVLWLFKNQSSPFTAPPPSSAALLPVAKSLALADPIPTAFTRLDPKSKAATLRALQALQEQLKSMPAPEAVGWIRNFLISGKDKPTGLSFEINADGSLKEWPTFRVFLLDALLPIDPTAATAIAREILTTPTTADEWALALRNIGRVETSAATNTFLRERTEALINNATWQASPSIGYLNAFDVIVHTTATASTSLLSSLIQRKDRKDLAHAGFLTLDRLVQKSPTETLTLLAADTALQQSRPEMAAQQIARADLRDPAQQGIVRKWLLDPDRSGTELRSFAGVFPNNNHFVSNNLLTTEAAPTAIDLTAHDREALEILHSWQTDPAFQPIAEHLQTMITRLDGFVGVPSSTLPAQ